MLTKLNLTNNFYIKLLTNCTKLFQTTLSLLKHVINTSHTNTAKINVTITQISTIHSAGDIIFEQL